MHSVTGEYNKSSRCATPQSWERFKFLHLAQESQLCHNCLQPFWDHLTKTLLTESLPCGGQEVWGETKPPWWMPLLPPVPLPLHVTQAALTLSRSVLCQWQKARFFPVVSQCDAYCAHPFALSHRSPRKISLWPWEHWQMEMESLLLSLRSSLLIQP